MEKTKEYTSPYEMDGRIPWPKAIVMVCSMFWQCLSET